MHANIKYDLTNWVDGMKIHKDHFLNSENALMDAIRDTQASMLTHFNFGLLPPAPGERSSLEYNIVKAQSDNYVITLTLCRAITAGGTRIEIGTSLDKGLTATSRFEQWAGGKKEFDYYYAVVTVNPFERVPYGEPSPSETPARHPFTRPFYGLDIISGEDLTAEAFGMYHFPVARFKRKGNEIIPDETWFPPSINIFSHPGMIALCKEIGSNLNRVQDYSNSIIRKVVAKSQNTALAQNVKKLSEINVQYISGIFFSFRTILPHQPPVFLLNAMLNLANTVKVSLDFMVEKEKEDLLQYFKEWTELTPTHFIELLANAIETEYDHYAIVDSYHPVITFLHKWASLFEQLNELELIGKRKDKDFIIRERVMGDHKNEKKKGFNFLE